MVVCRYFQQGRCARGDACVFEHPSKVNSTKGSSGVTTRSFVGQNDVEKQIPCVFFKRGNCRFGAACKNAHETSTSLAPPPSASSDPRSDIPCVFFVRNACSKGADCPFSHDSTLPASEFTPRRRADSGHAPVGLPDTKTEPYTSDQASESAPPRTIGGAAVTFGNGAVVDAVSLPSDYTTLALTNIPVAMSSEALHDKLKSWAQCDNITVLSVNVDTQHFKKSAQVKIADGGRAGRATIDKDHKPKLDGSDIDVKIVQLGHSESGTNRLQLSGVTCMWHDPSTTAHLWYSSAKLAQRVLSDLKEDKRMVRGRRPTVELARTPCCINLGNLDIKTTVKDIRYLVKEFHSPHDIGIGEKTHSVSSNEIERQVKMALESCGSLIEWSVTHQPGSAKVKAYAKFSTEQEAMNATKKGSGLLILGSNDRLHVQRVISVKLPVSQRVLGAIRPQFNAIIESARSAHYVSIKAYENPLKPYTQIRVSGADKTAVAQVKMQVEKLLAGHIASNGTQPLRVPYLFQSSSSTFLDYTMALHEVLIVQDRRKLVLRIYGEDKHVKSAEEALQLKASYVESLAKEIILDQVTLERALKGSFQHIVATLGKDKARLDVTSNPKRILVTGGDSDVALVREILTSREPSLSEATNKLSIKEDEEVLCAVCWTPAEDPIKTTCSHTYCESCFEAQATSSSIFPLRCLGDSGKCDVPLTLTDLKHILPRATYDALLESSLIKYVRMHPDLFQYCSTPDCDRFYRTSPAEAGIVFNCDHCLTAICTACHSAAHDGNTCAKSKAALDGTDEFEEWKKKNDVRDCPKCGTAMQKNAGCNHMTCSSCNAHICWRCMKVFERSSDVYTHMSKAHRDWGDGAVLPAEFL